MIRVKCPKCAASLRMADTSAGKVGKCPSCGQQFRVPQIAAKTVDPDAGPRPAKAPEAPSSRMRPAPGPSPSARPRPPVQEEDSDVLEDFEVVDEPKPPPRRPAPPSRLTKEDQDFEVVDEDQGPPSRRRRPPESDEQAMVSEDRRRQWPPLGKRTGAEDADAGAEPVPRNKRRRDHPRKGRPQRFNAKGLDKVNLGLTFHYARMVLLIFCIVALVLCMVALPFVAVAEGGRAALNDQDDKPIGGGLALLTLLILLISLAMDFLAPLLGVIGSILCLYVPSQSGARGVLIASLALDLIAIVVGLLLRLLSLFPDGEILAALGMIPAFLMGFIAWALFMLYLQKLSAYLDEETLAEEAIAILIRGIIILFVAPIAFIAMVLVLRAGCFGLCAALVLLGYGLYYFFIFLRRQLDLIGSLRQVIASHY